MHRIIVLSIHARMHHKDSRFKRCAFTGLEYHRTDGQVGRSASLQYFNEWLFLESQCTIPFVGNLEGELAVLTKLHISVVNLVLIHGKGGCSATISTISVGK